MPALIPRPTVILAAGNKPKQIEEFIGRVHSQTQALSIARMISPSGWIEPGQTPEFDEYIAVCVPAFSRQTVHRDESP
jgi:hypothetical protein